MLIKNIVLEDFGLYPEFIFIIFFFDGFIFVKYSFVL